MTNEQKEQTRKQLHRLLDIVLDTNGLESRSRDETGNQPTMFFQYYGQVNQIEISICRNGYETGELSETLLARYLDKADAISDESIAYVEEICKNTLAYKTKAEILRFNIMRQAAKVEQEEAHLDELREQLIQLESGEEK